METLSLMDNIGHLVASRMVLPRRSALLLSLLLSLLAAGPAAVAFETASADHATQLQQTLGRAKAAVSDGSVAVAVEMLDKMQHVLLSAQVH